MAPHPHQHAGGPPLGAADDPRPGGNERFVVAAFERLLHDHHIVGIDALFTDSFGEPLDKPGLPSWRERRRLVLHDVDGPRVFYLKRFTNSPASARRDVRRSRTPARSVAGLEWEWMHRLSGDGVPCAQPVALAEEFCGSREIRSAILSAAVAGDSLERWVLRWGPADRPIVSSLIRPLAMLIARLHAGGYVHRDLYLSHIFFDPAAPPGDSLRLIDLQRMLRPKGSMGRWIVKDLAALNFSVPGGLVSRTDRLRWLKVYRGAVKLDGSARRLAYRIIGKTLRMQRRTDRRRLREHVR